jgi:hypothetical protein
MVKWQAVWKEHITGTFMSVSGRFVKSFSHVNISIAHCQGINILYTFIMVSCKALEALRGHSDSVVDRNSGYIRQAV